MPLILHNVDQNAYETGYTYCKMVGETSKSMIVRELLLLIHGPFKTHAAVLENRDNNRRVHGSYFKILNKK